MRKFDIIEKNEFGRKKVIRYKQYAYGNVEGIGDFTIARQGCGVTTLATILSSLGYLYSPEEIAKMILLDDKQNLIDFYIDKEKGCKGIKEIAFIYLLNELIEEQICDISYKLIKVSYECPELKKQIILDMVKKEYMAMICVGPHSDFYPMTFSHGDIIWL